MMMKKRQAGLTMIEIIIASVIMAALFAITLLLLTRSSKHVETEQINLNLEMEAREVVNQIGLDLRQSRLDMLTQGPSAVAISPLTSANDTTTYPDLWCRTPGKTSSMTSAQYLTAHKTNPDGLWTRRVRYFLAAEPGESNTDSVDNDRDGLVDESVIKKTEFVLNATGGVVSSSTSTICHFVKKSGLTFLVPFTNPGKVQITLTLEKPDPSVKGRIIAKTVQTTIDLRN
ncbi:MAG TPA: type II secretion system protein [Planctomycetota bacterium]|nr:type II secretion system protein [Planctomycetota bacterium]